MSLNIVHCGKYSGIVGPSFLTAVAGPTIGAASVVGACLVMIAMVFSGSLTAFLSGAICYTISTLAALFWRDPAPRLAA